MSTPVTAEQAWKARVLHAESPTGSLVWIMTACGVTPLRVSGTAQLKSLMWADNRNELTNYIAHSLDPDDCENRVLETESRHVYMTWKTLRESHGKKHINIPASRILVESYKLEPPLININMGAEDLTQYYNCFPSSHVVFHQTTSDGKMIDYDKKQFMFDWPHLTRLRQRAGTKAAYQVLAEKRYECASQALAEFEHTVTKSALMNGIITQYLKKRAGPCSHKIEAQIAILGAAMLHSYPKQWAKACDLPNFTRLIFK